jgi:diguanylate cyclase
MNNLCHSISVDTMNDLSQINNICQIFDTVNIGLVILDSDLHVQHWNRWMMNNSGIPAEEIVGVSIFDHFPNLKTPRFTRNCKSVLSFGNFSFFSQLLHKYLFPFKPVGSFDSRFEFMQQSCTMGPLRSAHNAITSLFLIVQDVTELAANELRLMEMNVKDPLTGVFNRRYLEIRFNDEFFRGTRYSSLFSVMMIDIDHFKNVNDTYGHQCGDQVLIAIASELSGIVRASDCFARFGGEEFCCLLPETKLESALILAERFRQRIENLCPVYQNDSIPVTISIGITELRSGDTVETILDRADEALYTAKHNGRNRVETALSNTPHL